MALRAALQSGFVILHCHGNVKMIISACPIETHRCHDAFVFADNSGFCGYDITSGANSDDKVGIIPTIRFLWLEIWPARSCSKWCLQSIFRSELCFVAIWCDIVHVNLKPSFRLNLLALGQWYNWQGSNSGLLFTKKVPSYEFRNPQYKPKTVWRPSQVYNGNHYMPLRRCLLSR